MKKNLLVISLIFALMSCNNSSSNSSEDIYTTVGEEEFYCPNCNGTGYYNGVCIVCEGGGKLLRPIKTTYSNNGSNISFKGVQYGSCNSGCGCKGYVHQPGKDWCVSCRYYGCTQNKFGHREL